MLNRIYTALFIVAAGLIGGCCTSATQRSAAATQAIVTSVSYVMKSGGANVLKLTTAPATKCAAAEGSFHFTVDAPQYEVEVWLVHDAATIDAALPSVNTQIISEFKDFKPEHTTDLTVAGSPAKQLIGTGHEADDGDPGDADVIVFKVGDHIFVACNHGESLTPAGQAGLLTLVQTAQAP